MTYPYKGIYPGSTHKNLSASKSFSGDLYLIYLVSRRPIGHKGRNNTLVSSTSEMARNLDGGPSWLVPRGQSGMSAAYWGVTRPALYLLILFASRHWIPHLSSSSSSVCQGTWTSDLDMRLWHRIEAARPPPERWQFGDITIFKPNPHGE